MNEDMGEYLKKQADIGDKRNAVTERYGKNIKKQLYCLVAIVCLTVFWVVYGLVGLFKALPVFISFDLFISASLFSSLTLILIGQISNRRFKARMVIFQTELLSIRCEYYGEVRGLPLSTKGELPE